MIKKHKALFLSFALIFLIILPVKSFADIKPSIVVNGISLPLNSALYTEKQIIVYGNPNDVFALDPNLTNPQGWAYSPSTGKNEWRYLGYRADTTPYANPDFPPDPGGITGDYATRNYVQEPWNRDLYYPGTTENLCNENNQAYVEQLKAVWPYIASQLPQDMPAYMLDASALAHYWSIQSYPLPGEIYGTLREWHWRNDWPWYDTYRVKFRPDETVNLSVEPSTATKKVGETQQYKAIFKLNGTSVDVTIDPNTTWTINASSIATIDKSGLVNANSPGMATITAQYNDPSFGLLTGTASITVVTQPSEPVTPGGNIIPGNLSITDLQLLDASTGQQVSNPTGAQMLKVKATYNSTFNVAGQANLRLYKYNRDIKKLNQIGDAFSITINPSSTITHEWDIGNLGSGEFSLIASIDYLNNTNDPSSCWQRELFNGSEEATYDDNKLEKGTSASKTYVALTPFEEGAVGYYPPMREIEIIGDPQPVYGWKRVPLIRDKSKDRIVTILER